MIIFLKGEILHKNKLILSRINFEGKDVPVETRFIQLKNIDKKVANPSDVMNHKDVSLTRVESIKSFDNETLITPYVESVDNNENHRVLISPDTNDGNDIIYTNYEKDDVCLLNVPVDKRWITERKKNRNINHNKMNSSLYEIESFNGFNLLDDDAINSSGENDDDEEHNKISTNITTVQCRTRNNHESSNVRKRPEIVVNLHQANDTLIPLKKDIKRIVPGNPSYMLTYLD